MKELIQLQPHASVPDDWDFSNVAWELDTTRFVSPPSSLHGTVPTDCVVLCKHPAAIRLTEGMLVTQAYSADYLIAVAHFRNQAPVGTAAYLDTYSVFCRTTYSRLRRYVDGSYTDIGDWTYLPPFLQWNKFRVSWWEGYDRQNEDKLHVRLEAYEDGEWVQKGDDLIDPLNMWSGSPVNRPGVVVRSVRWIDDTQIWLPI